MFKKNQTKSTGGGGGGGSPLISGAVTAPTTGAPPLGGGGGGGGAGEGRDYHVKAQQLLLMREATPAKTRTIGHNEHVSHQKVIAVTIACD